MAQFKAGVQKTMTSRMLRTWFMLLELSAKVSRHESTSGMVKVGSAWPPLSFFGFEISLVGVNFDHMVSFSKQIS